MKRETAKDIAIALIAISGNNFDTFAFDDCFISDSDKNKILQEIQYQCDKMVSKIEDKYSITLGSTTNEIIEGIMFE